MKEEVKVVFSCEITGGSGKPEDGGDFIIRETPKTLTFECVREPFFSNRMSGKKPIKIQKYHSKWHDNEPAWKDCDGYTKYANNGHVARKWQNGSWTLYPDQCGIPHVLERKHLPL